MFPITTLQKFPTTISNLETQTLNKYQAKCSAKKDIDLFLVTLDTEIAANKELKNETARKAYRADTLINNQAYIDLCEIYDIAENSYKRSQIELEQAKNEFSVLKLELNYLISQNNKLA